MAGFKYSLTVDGVESSWARIEFTGANPGVKVTSRLKADGTTNDPCFADWENDENMGTLKLTEFIRRADDDRGDAQSFGFGIVEGTRDPDMEWSFAYDGIEIAAGTGLYCPEGAFSGAIPGESTGVITLYTIGEYTRN